MINVLLFASLIEVPLGGFKSNRGARVVSPELASETVDRKQNRP